MNVLRSRFEVGTMTTRSMDAHREPPAIPTSPAGAADYGCRNEMFMRATGKRECISWASRRVHCEPPPLPWRGHERVDDWYECVHTPAEIATRPKRAEQLDYIRTQSRGCVIRA